MVFKVLYLFREVKYLFLTFMTFFVVYCLAMDVVLYQTLQNTTLVEESHRVIPKIHSPFHPLTVKLLTLDHYSHYFIKPTAELFNYVTDFSNIFFFVTPNMISATHVLVGLVVGKFVSSESLRQRRIGALLYEFRTWLDGLDGVVYRSRKGQTTYTTQGNAVGSHIDNICDVIGGVALSIGTLFYLFRKFDNNKEELPKSKTVNDNQQLHGVSVLHPSKKLIVFKMALYGCLVGIAGNSWEHFVTSAENVFERKIQNPQLSALQTDLLHNCTTWSVLWSWKLVGQQMLQYLVVAILVDRVWEFITFILLVGYPVTITLILSSCFYIKYCESALYGAEAVFGLEKILSESTVIPGR